MAPELRTIPDVLSYVGTELANHGRALLDVQQTSHRDAEDAQQGWVGSSAKALSELLDRWTVASTGQLARLSEHSDGMRLAAVGFSEMEQSNAASLR